MSDCENQLVVSKLPCKKVMVGHDEYLSAIFWQSDWSNLGQNVNELLSLKNSRYDCDV